MLSIIHRAIVGATLAAAMFAATADGAAAQSFTDRDAGPMHALQQNGFKKIGEHGSWSAFTDGDRAMVSDEFDDGTRFAIAILKDGAGLIINAPGFNLEKSRSFDIKIDVDGEVYTGRITAMDNQTMVTDKIDAEFLKAMYRGKKATVSIGDFRLDLTLANASAALDDVVRYTTAAQ